MASPLDKLSLEQLYDRSHTPSVLKRIHSKDDFTSINPTYCNKVCQLSYKSCDGLTLSTSFEKPVDVAIVLDHHALGEEYKSYQELDAIYRGIFGYLKNSCLKGKEVSAVYAFKCPIRREDTRVNGRQPPTTSILKKCSIYAHNELKAMKPKVTIMTSATAVKILGLNYKVGGMYQHPDYGIVIVSMHPRILTMIRQNASGANWGPDFLSIMEWDFKRAAGILDGSIVFKDLDVALKEVKQRIHIARSMDDVERFLDLLYENGSTRTLSYDIESTGVDPWAVDAKIITLQFGFKNKDGIIEAYVLPAWHRENTWYDPADMWQGTRELILDGNIRKIGHNIKFDACYTYACTGARIQGIVGDTMLYLHNINSGLQGNYDLKSAVWRWLPETNLGGYEDKLPSLTRRKGADGADDDLAEDSGD